MHDNGIWLAVARIYGLIQSEATAIDYLASNFVEKSLFLYTRLGI